MVGSFGRRRSKHCDAYLPSVRQLPLGVDCLNPGELAELPVVALGGSVRVAVGRSADVADEIEALSKRPPAKATTRLSTLFGPSRQLVTHNSI